MLINFLTFIKRIVLNKINCNLNKNFIIKYRKFLTLIFGSKFRIIFLLAQFNFENNKKMKNKITQTKLILIVLGEHKIYQTLSAIKYLDEFIVGVFF